MQTLKSLRFWMLPALSGVSLVLIFPRFELSFLAWAALVPLLFAIWGRPLRRVAACGFVTGMVFYFFGLHWVVNTMVNFGNLPPWVSYPILALLAAYLSFYLALFCTLLIRFSHNDPVRLFLLAPPLWTSLEWLRSTHLEYGFSWLGLGYSQAPALPIIQIAEITGIYGVSALIVAVNAGVFVVLKERWAPEEGPASSKVGLPVLAVSAGLFLLAAGYGWVQLQRMETPPGAENTLSVGLAQGNIDQHIKWNPRFSDQVLTTYARLTQKAAAAQPDLVVWPEAAVPFFYGFDAEGSKKVDAIVDTAEVPLLFGSPYRAQREGQTVLYNSAYFLAPGGQLKGRYDKKHLVPFGEFVPLQSVLFFVEKMVTGVGNFGRGEEFTLFDIKNHRFGVSICFEIAFPNLVRQPVNRGANFLVNITNDAWFGKSAASYQHMAMGVLRAVENRVPIVRAANTGISGTIDPDGRMRQRTELFQEALVLTRIAPASGPRSFYSRHGDVFSYACLVLTGLMAAGFFWADKKTGN